MSVDINVHIYCKNIDVSEILIEKIINSALKTGLEYYRAEGDPPLQNISRIISGQHEGFVSFRNEHGTLFSLGFSKESDKPIKGLPELNITVTAASVGYYDRATTDKKLLPVYIRNGKIIAQIAKNIWNFLDVKPLFGIGDYETNMWEGAPISSVTPADVNKSEVFKKIDLNPCWMNLYGPELLKKINEKKIMQGMWKTVKLDRGSMILREPVPSPSHMPEGYANLDTVKKEFDSL